MKNLKVWQKLLLLGVIFMLPFARVTYKLVSTINSEKVGFAQNEANGVAYYAPLLGLLKDVQQHRGLAGAMLSGDASFKDPVTTKEADIENDIKAVDAVDQQLGGGLQVTEKWKTLRAACHDFLQKAKELSVVDSYQQHTKLIGDIITLISDVSDNSQLTLDPDIDSYYLMDVIMFQGPELSEKLSQASALGTAMAVNKASVPEQFESLNRQSILAEYVQDEVADSLNRALTFNSTLHSQLDTPAQFNAKGVEQACGYLKNLAASRKMDTSATDYDSTMTKSIEPIFNLEAQAAKSLTTLLNIRIEKWQSTMYEALAESILWLLLAWLVAFFIIRNITIPLKKVVAVADQIANGNLVLDLTRDPRRDEMGVLSHAFDRMVASLKEMVGVAEQIAAGNLAVTVKPRSEHDLMGKAFATMTEKLSGLVSQVQKSGIQVNTSVTEIAATSKQQQATATEIAATTSEISATSRQIAATSRELVKNMSQVTSVADQSATMAGSGQAGLTRMEETMGQVMEAAGSINAKLAVLSEKASNINQVVTTITKVADQTNLLSLNAAIEAEKAGEYGRGFAVVATEIRRLADQTAVATYDIAQMVKEIQSAVAAGVMGMDKFSEEVRRGINEVQQVSGQLTQITHDVQSLAPRFEAVNDGMQAQSTAAEQITEALAQLSEAAQQTVESLRQSNQVIDGLNQASIGLRGSVSKFKLEE